MRVTRRAALAAISATALAAAWPQARTLASTTDLIELQRARIDIAPDGEHFVLSADFDLELTTRLEDAVNRGVPLYFRVELEVTRPRWYWWDESTASAVMVFRLAYHALTRQYRLSRDGEQLWYGSLQEALEAMSRIRGWAVAPRAQLKPGEVYDVAVRMRFDTTQLPKPFQIAALTNRDWNTQSEWKRFAYKPPTQTTSAQ